MSKWLDTIKKRKETLDYCNRQLVRGVSSGIELYGSNCKNCNKEINPKEFVHRNRVCSCGYHYRLGVDDRINITFDEDSVEIFEDDVYVENLLDFPEYAEKLDNLRKHKGLGEAVVTGKGKIIDIPVYFGVMDTRFIMGSMGAAVGEKLTRMIERATNDKAPVIIFAASGGARMQEGMISLYQMAKVVGAVNRHSEQRLLYICVMTDPTTGGVNASFASIADIIIAEPNATIGFAGKRVIKNVEDKKSQENFQTSEFHYINGHIDILCERNKLRKTLFDVIDIYSGSKKQLSGKIIHKIATVNNIKFSFENIDAWERVKLSRSLERPNYEKYKNIIFEKFVQLHGDRISKDDKALVTGIALLNGIPVTGVFCAKGKNLTENIEKNFGMASPEGYRKVERIVKLSEKFGLPIVTFIDTPGAFCGEEAEKTGQSAAIAKCIALFSDVTVPIISVVTGEGGSGGALALGVANWVIMLENAIYSVISPEGCSSILFKNNVNSQKVSEYLKLCAKDLIQMNIIDQIVPEPNEWSQEKTKTYIENIKDIVYNKIIELNESSGEYLKNTRYDRFRSIGAIEYGEEDITNQVV